MGEPMGAPMERLKQGLVSTALCNVEWQVQDTALTRLRRAPSSCRRVLSVSPEEPPGPSTTVARGYAGFESAREYEAGSPRFGRQCALHIEALRARS
jgi:hypothetical protein